MNDAHDRARELASLSPELKLGGEVKPPRRCASCRDVIKHDEDSKFCEKCAEPARERAAQAAFRAAIFERDKGVCATCGEDTLRVRATADMFKACGGDAWQTHVRLLKKSGFDEKAVREGHSLWIADHIRELADDGNWTLANGQTLCQPCSHAKTNAFASKRAASRKSKTRRFGR